MSTNTENYLLVQDYLLTHTFAELRAEHGVKFRPSACGRKVSMNYDMIEAHDSNKIAQECRGLVLAKVDNSVFVGESEIIGETKVLARPFHRFFNLGQDAAAKIDFNDPETRFYEKLDGCCHESTLVRTSLGTLTIKEICENYKQGISALSFNIITGELEFDEIVGSLIQDNNNNWYELELEDGSKVVLTGNHKIYLPELSCYRRVDELSGQEKVLVLREA